MRPSTAELHCTLAQVTSGRGKVRFYVTRDRPDGDAKILEAVGKDRDGRTGVGNRGRRVTRLVVANWRDAERALILRDGRPASVRIDFPDVLERGGGR